MKRLRFVCFEMVCTPDMWCGQIMMDGLWTGSAVGEWGCPRATERAASCFAQSNRDG